MVQTPEVPLPWKLAQEAKGELGGTTEEAFQKSVIQSRIGVSYLVDRKKIEREHKARRKKLLDSPEPQSFRETKTDKS